MLSALFEINYNDKVMEFRYLQLFFVILLAFTNGDESDESEEDFERIVGGKDAQCRIKYQVSLEYRDYHFCSGALINQYWIVTIASCINIRPNVIAVGSNNRKSPSIMKYYISKWITHEKSNSSIYYNIGLVKSAEKIYGENVGYLYLPEKDVKTNAPLVITGWGVTNYPEGKTPDQLQILKTKSISQRECAIQHNTTIKIRKEILCTFRKAEHAICSGDMGSPVVGRNILYGIVSTINPCYSGKPDISFRISTMTAWIANKLLKYM